MISLLLAACGGGSTEVDDGGDVPSTIRITATAAPLIGDTLRVTAVARNRGGRELPLVQPAVAILISGRAVRAITDGVALATDTGRVVITARTGTLTVEQVLSVGMPANLDLAIAAQDSVGLGDTVTTIRADVRRDGVARDEISASLSSSDTTVFTLASVDGRVTLRPVATGVASINARLGTRTVTRAVRVTAARIQSFAFVPTPTVLDPGDRAVLSVAAFDILGQVVPEADITYSVVSGPGVIEGGRGVRATAPGAIVVRAAARGVAGIDTVDVMPPSSFTLTIRPGFTAGVPATIPPRLRTAIDRAVKRWRQVISTDLPAAPLQLGASACANPDLNESVSGVLVHVRVPALGFGGTLARATACVLRPDGRTMLGIMEFNSDILDRLSDDELFYTAAHELGHVLGIGTVWYRADGQPALVTLSGINYFFVGAQARAEFDLLENRTTYSGMTVPISADRGHWDSRVMMMELMEPFSRATTRFSRVTVGAIADMGYVTNARSWDRYALPLPGFSSSPAPRVVDLREDVMAPYGVALPDGRVVRIPPR
ncbi:MAG: leishmanolysin-related zinc metalloendopeptidase [Gemmatimonadota bacterium]